MSGLLRATSRQAKGCDHVLVRVLGSHPKAIPLTWCWNLCQVYLLEVGLMQILVGRETLFKACHVGTHVDLSSMINSLGP
jgi:hypothetical protein